jgi:metal-responsive CopG/Arc/MetJ family transcriptional regulator
MMLSYRRELSMAVKKVAVTLPEELFRMVERARRIEHRTRSEVIQEALRTHFGEPVYVPTEAERRMLDEALADLHDDPESGRSWEDVRREIRPDG